MPDRVEQAFKVAMLAILGKVEESLAESINFLNSQRRTCAKWGQSLNNGAPAKRASTRVEVPPVQLDGSAPKTVPTASPRGGVGVSVSLSTSGARGS